MKFIDPHIHLWDTDQGDYHWLHNTNNLPLQVNDSALTCEAYVHVEAGFDNNQPWRELGWLESVATKPMRAVATLDLTLFTAPFVESLLHYAKHTFCVGGRHILDNDALDLLRNPQVLHNLDTLAQHGYLFEAQFDVADQAVVARVCELLQANPDWQWVINHAGYPDGLYHVNANGEIKKEVALPAELLAVEKRFGFEGVTRVGDTLWMATQREWKDDPKNHVKLVSYNTSTGEWGAVHYPKAEPAKGWVGLSEIVANGDYFYVIERDNQIGSNVVTKKIYRIPAADMVPAALGGTLPVVSKEEVRDLIPDLKSYGGYVVDTVDGLPSYRRCRDPLSTKFQHTRNFHY